MEKKGAEALGSGCVFSRKSCGFPVYHDGYRRSLRALCVLPRPPRAGSWDVGSGRRVKQMPLREKHLPAGAFGNTLGQGASEEHQWLV